MKRIIAKPENSFNIPGMGILIDLQHQENGLVAYSELVSEQSGKVWLVLSRILFDHATNQQILFECETTEILTKGFETEQRKNDAVQLIINKEKEKIYHYLLKPVDHNSIPKDGEVLLWK